MQCKDKALLNHAVAFTGGLSGMAVYWNKFSTPKTKWRKTKTFFIGGFLGGMAAMPVRMVLSASIPDDCETVLQNKDLSEAEKLRLKMMAQSDLNP